MNVTTSVTTAVAAYVKVTAIVTMSVTVAVILFDYNEQVHILKTYIATSKTVSAIWEAS